MSLELKPVTLVLLAAHDTLMCMGWMQGAEAKNEMGIHVNANDKDACNFCLAGAIISTEGSITDDAFNCLNRAILGQMITTWNDRKGRTKKQVLNVLIKAAELSEASE